MISPNAYYEVYDTTGGRWSRVFQSGSRGADGMRECFAWALASGLRPRDLEIRPFHRESINDYKATGGEW